jgi:hypothetical protein
MTQCSDMDKRSLELIAFDEDFRGALQGTLGSPPQEPACRAAAAWLLQAWWSLM